MLQIGVTDEAVLFTGWLRDRWRHPDAHGTGPLQLMYGVDGRSELTEFELPHLDGYKGSRPVRVGNGAHDQLQLDIYGELMDSVYLFNKYASPIGYDDWRKLRDMLDWVCDNWQRPDEGVWEVRGGRRDF
ncbi:MAG TPA: glycoside hydrolase family 15 protein, partial [Urbifossiella sp.]|nr:glycoside hydrolase family 15 protein [Urbifossiella sp.]